MDEAKKNQKEPCDWGGVHIFQTYGSSILGLIFHVKLHLLKKSKSSIYKLKMNVKNNKDSAKFKEGVEREIPINFTF